MHFLSVRLLRSAQGLRQCSFIPETAIVPRRMDGDTLMQQMTDIPFGTTDWSTVEVTEHKGATGMARWRTRNY
jgi:hypothetical protein